MPMTTTETLRALILAELTEQKVTQTELARRIGRSTKHVSQTLTGKVTLSASLADSMLRALGRKAVVTVEDDREAADENMFRALLLKQYGGMDGFLKAHGIHAEAGEA